MSISLTNVGGSLVVNPPLGGVQDINLANYANLYNAVNNSINVPVSYGTTNILNNNLPYGEYASLLTGIDGSVNALVLDTSGDLYAGGSFGSAGGVSVNNIAKWDGSSWSDVGGGLIGTVYALIFDNAGVLYAGGSMPGYLSKWDGSNWTSLGASFGAGLNLNGPVYALTLDPEFNQILYFGGSFSAPYSNIASTNTLGNTVIDNGGANGAVRALAFVFFEGNTIYRNVIAGGDFTQIGSNSLSVNHIARLYTLAVNQWDTVPAVTTLDAPVYSIHSTDEGLLYIGGNFTSPVSHIGLSNANFTFNTFTFTGLGSGVNDIVRTLALDGSGNVYAGGDFTTADGNTANRIAKWDGSTWSSLGDGVNNSVRALATVDNSLYIGGDFTQANGNAMDHITEIPNTSAIFGAVDVSVNSKFLYALYENQKINVFVTNSGVAYTNGLVD